MGKLFRRRKVSSSIASLTAAPDDPEGFAVILTGSVPIPPDGTTVDERAPSQ